MRRIISGVIVVSAIVNFISMFYVSSMLYRYNFKSEDLYVTSIFLISFFLILASQITFVVYLNGRWGKTLDELKDEIRETFIERANYERKSRTLTEKIIEQENKL